MKLEENRVVVTPVLLHLLDLTVTTKVLTLMRLISCYIYTFFSQMKCEALSCKIRVTSLTFFLKDSTHSWAKPPKKTSCWCRLVWLVIRKLNIWNIWQHFLKKRIHRVIFMCASRPYILVSLHMPQIFFVLTDELVRSVLHLLSPHLRWQDREQCGSSTHTTAQRHTHTCFTAASLSRGV